VTLPNEEVMEMLSERFVLCARNIEREEHVGLSHGYACDQTAVGTTNGAGGRNVQMIVLAPDETVLHALPGFWHAQDLLPELRLALEVHRLYVDETLSPASKLAMFGALHRAHQWRYGDAAKERGDWQGFDGQFELARAEKETRDTVVADAAGKHHLKAIPDLVHERMAARPFKKLAEFGMEAFVDYGRPFYDNNMGLDDGRNFPRAAQANQKRERERDKVEKEAAKVAEKEAKAADKEAKAAGKKVPASKSGAPVWQPAPPPPTAGS